MRLREISPFAVLIALLAVALADTWSDLAFEPRLERVSAVETQNNIRVYWDASCDDVVDSVSWGVLSPGESKTITVYVRNEGNETLVLVLAQKNLSPPDASDYLNLEHAPEDCTIEKSEVVQVTLTLNIFQNVTGINQFGFDIIFETELHVSSDLNDDGMVNIQDVSMVAVAWHTKPGNPKWNPVADLDKNGWINVLDLTMVARDWGKTA